MKKILITLSVTILCLGLSACGNKETDKSKNQVTVSSSKETEKNQGSNIQEEELRNYFQDSTILIRGVTIID